MQPKRSQMGNSYILPMPPREMEGAGNKLHVDMISLTLAVGVNQSRNKPSGGLQCQR